MIDDQYSEAIAALGTRFQADELAEWHGTLTGILCAAKHGELAARLAALGPPGGEQAGAGDEPPCDAGDDAHGPAAGRAPAPGSVAASSAPGASRPRVLEADAERVVAATCRSLDEAALTFQPLLLEEVPLTERALALGAWCQGFLVGLATTLPDVATRLHGEALEALEDFGELARAVRGGEQAEEAENAYAELVEFVRVGVLIMYEDLRSARSSDAGEESIDGAGSDEHDPA